ncbi:MAG: fluoride efflux transporter CrcB [Phycisphaeraceae bacterium]|nr:fluoride efflux transporter CrcB [Phycisphaeraceae bacterium]
MAVNVLLNSSLVFLGAGAGGLLRYWIGAAVQNWWGSTFPIGTLLVNVSGCLAMGFFATAWMGPVLVREECRIAILIGVLGGYTTFSTFGRETLELISRGEWIRAGAYVLASVFVSLVAVWAGAVAAHKIYGA